jgi:hypothetical protein
LSGSGLPMPVKGDAIARYIEASAGGLTWSPASATIP